MSFERPTLATLVERIEADFVSRLPLVGALLRRAVARIFSRVVAGAAHMLHGHLDFLARQLFPDLSEEEYLVRQAALFGLAKTAPGYAEAVAIVTGTNTTVIPIGTVLTRADGATYTTDAEVTIATLTAWVNTTAYVVGDLRRNGGIVYICTVAGTSAGSGGPTGTGAAITDGTVTWGHVATGTAAVACALTAEIAGADGTLTVGVSLAFESPIAGADGTAPVTSVTTDGTDEETDAALCVRLLARMDAPPHGGNDADWIAWAKSVAGVTRAWVTRLGLGPGTVLVRFVRDNDASIIPSAGEVAAVQAVFDLEGPAHCTATAFAPVLLAQAFGGSVVPNTAAVKAAVEAEIADLFLRRGSPGGTILLSEIRTAFGTAAGVTDYTLTNPVADVTHTANQLPSVGTFTWA